MEKFSNYVKKERKEKEEEIGKISRVRVHKFDEITILQDVQETNVPPRLQNDARRRWVEAGLRSNTAYEFQQSGRTFTRINGLWDSCVTYLRWQKKSRLPRLPIIYAQIRYSSITLLSYIPPMFPRFYRSVPFSFSSFPSLPPLPPSLPFFLSSYNPFLFLGSPRCAFSRPYPSLALLLLPSPHLYPSLHVCMPKSVCTKVACIWTRERVQHGFTLGVRGRVPCKRKKKG